MSSWSPAQYLKFADERTRAARNLLVAVPLAEVRRAGEGEPAQRSPRSQAT